MMIHKEKLLKIGIDFSTALLPAATRWRLRLQWRGRLKISRCRNADHVILSRPKSGRTWLRAMLSTLFIQHYDLPKAQLLDFDNFNAQDQRIPKIAFTHGQGLTELPDITTEADWLRNKPVVFLMRHPCDIAVSVYFECTKRRSPTSYKHILHGNNLDLPMFEFVMKSMLDTIDYMNKWHRHLKFLPNVIVVRYEDMRMNPEKELTRIVRHINGPFTATEISQAVEQCSFNRLHEKEKCNYYRTRRLAPRDINDPASYKVRRGVVGGYRDYFSPAQIQILHDRLHQSLAPSFDYHADNLFSEFAKEA